MIPSTDMLRGSSCPALDRPATSVASCGLSLSVQNLRCLVPSWSKIPGIPNARHYVACTPSENAGRSMHACNSSQSHRWRYAPAPRAEVCRTDQLVPLCGTWGGTVINNPTHRTTFRHAGIEMAGDDNYAHVLEEIMPLLTAQTIRCY